LLRLGRGRSTVCGLRGNFCGFVGIALFASADELEVLDNHAQFAAELAGRLVFPLVEAQTPLDQDALALHHPLGDGLGLFAEGVAIDEGDLLLLRAVLSGERAVHGKADLADRRARRRDPGVRIAREVTHQDDFVVGGHAISR